jgi:hypothetical protein
MLIAIGVMIAVVLAVMTGTTAHAFEQVGWLGTHQTALILPVWCSRWLGLSATCEAIAAQITAPVFVVGSYFLARQVQRPATGARGPPCQAGPAVGLSRGWGRG